MQKYFRLLRIHQWIKNLFIFVPAFFDQQLTLLECLTYAVTGFFAFSFLSSAVYIFNDYRDLKEDRMHPKKKFRPLASGEMPVYQAFTIMIVLILASALISLKLNPIFLLILGAYLLINALYSFKLKHVPILDVSIVALGFVMRVYAGGILCGIELSEWIIMITFLIALFIALAKRRDDVLLFIQSGHKTRRVIDGYNLEFLNVAMSIMASVVIVSYLMYTLSAEVTDRLGTDYIFLTVIFVILGIFRYLQKAFVEEDTGSPTEIVYKDRFIQLTVLAWLTVIFYLLYFY